MKIKPDSVYQIKLSGHQIFLIRHLIIQGDIRRALSEKGQTIADALYESLENDIEEIKKDKPQH